MRRWWARMRRTPPPGYNPEIWALAQANAREPYRGETANEPHVRRQLQALRGLLARIRHGDAGHHEAHARLAAAVIRRETANERSLEMNEAKTLADADARDRDPNVAPGAVIIATAERDVHVERERARRERLAAGAEERLANQAVQEADTALYDRLMEAATTGLEPINEYVAAYNQASIYERVRGIAPLPDNLADQLVAQAIGPGGDR